MHIKVISVTWSYDPELVSMAANARIIKSNVTLYRIINSDTAFERHGSRIPIRDDMITVQALKKHLVSFLVLKELSPKYGLGEFEIKIYHMLPKPGGQSNNFAVTTGWTVETGASIYAGWHSKRNEQYVFLMLWYLVLIEIWSLPGRPPSVVNR